jgi:LPLT family lysophospholipid transporter-like MFS transporter
LKLWRDPLGGVSLRVTTFSWGVGAVLQFLVLVWAQTQAGLTLQAGAYLQGVVALGVIGGAVTAALTCRICNARRQRVWAMVLACLMPALALTQSVWLAVPMLLAAGWAGGMLLVPMNALLQHRGHKIMPPGRSIAVQGFNENLSVLVMLGLYSLVLAWDWSLLAMMLCMSVPLWFAALPWRQVKRTSTLG